MNIEIKALLYVKPDRTYRVKLEENCSYDIFSTNGRILVVFFDSIVSPYDVLEGQFGPSSPMELW